MVLGLAIGLGLGLVYTWMIAPVVEFDTAPAQLSREARTDYLIAISLAYRADADLRRAVDRLLELGLPGDPFQALADTACEIFRQGVDTNSKRNAIEAMIALYSPQGRTGCADASNLFTIARATPTPFPTVIPVTPSLTPPPSKTPVLFTPPPSITPPTAAPLPTATPLPQADDYLIANIQTFCSTELAGVIEVYVQSGGRDVPGVTIRVTWGGGSDEFLTGLKPERGVGYADFQMEANRAYTVEIPGQSRRSNPLTASACFTEGGSASSTSYRVIFRRNQ